MNDVWFTSDTHFGHPKVANVRGFEGSAEHDAAIVERWNSVVQPGDAVWHLGDVGMGRITRFQGSVEQLHGTIHVVLGNHDEPSPVHRDGHKHQRTWMQHFTTVQAFARRRIAGHQVLLSHYPYRGAGDHTLEERYTQYRFVDEGLWLLHGHTHSTEQRIGRMIHVGVDAWILTPVSLHTIASIIDTPHWSPKGLR